MSRAWDQRVEDIFTQALSLDSAADLDSFLAGACGEDSTMLARVQELLRFHSGAGRFINSAGILQALGAGPERSHEGVHRGSRIGRYRIIEKVGEGGFGVVYLAEQEEPVRRKVALKIIKPGMDTNQVVARFEAERQALAMMDHPNIAKVHDAGATENGRPYFVMELVHGSPITKFCEENQLTVRERIELFIPVCRAIQHAHQKGIIHRDIKPTNVLIASGLRSLRLRSGQAGQHHGAIPPGQTDTPPSSRNRDYGVAGTDPRPMVIDFGVAKAMEQRLTGKTLFTNSGQMVGTPAYMSPEQAEMSKQAVDTRTDVYSLGILLFELLTGTTPFPEERFKQLGYAEIQRIIAEEEPIPPSTVLARLNGESREVAANRKCLPAALLKVIKGDLDWIVLKAIDKDRNRRYATPLELAADLQRYLLDQPIAARPPSKVYALRKFARRNRVAVTGGLVIAAISILGIASISWQTIRATRSERQALEERANAEAALRFLKEMLERADPFLSDPNRPPDRKLPLLSAILNAAQDIDSRFEKQPLVEAEIRLTLGNALRNLGENNTAEPHLRTALEKFNQELGPAHSNTLEAALALARLLISQSKFETAATLSAETLEVCERTLGSQNDLTLQAMSCLAWAYGQGDKDLEALALFQETLERIQQSGTPNPTTLLTTLQGLAGVHYELGHFKERGRLLHEIHQSAGRLLGLDHPVTLASAVSLLNHFRASRPREAEQLAEEIYPVCLRVLGEEHPATIYLLSELARLEEAKGMAWVPLQRQVLQISESGLGLDHPQSVLEKMWLAMGLMSEGDRGEAETLMLEAVESIHRLQGPDTLMSRRSRRWLSRVYLAQDRFEDAAEARTQEACRRLLGMQSPWAQAEFWAHANVHARHADWAKAAQSYEEFLPYAPLHYNGEAAMPAGSAWTAHGAGLLAAWLAEDRECARRIANRGLERFVSTRSPEVACEVVMPQLLLPGGVVDLQRCLKLSDQALAGLEDPVRRTLLEGITSFRRSQWPNAADTLSPFASNPDGTIAALAGSFLAMAQYQSGARDAALCSLSNATVLLERLTRQGDLGKTTRFPDEAWTPVAGVIVACYQAEELIRGHRVSPAIDPSYLNSARAKWKEVQALIDQAEMAARGRKWEEAKDGFLKAARHPYFSWEAAAYDGNGLGLKLAALFVLTGDTDNYELLCRRLLSHAMISQTEFAFPALLSSEKSELQQRALAIARWRSRRPGLRLLLALAEFRNGNLEGASAALEKPLEAFNLNRSGTAHALAALGETTAGRVENAKESLSLAEEMFGQLIAGRQGDLGREWKDTAVFEIILNEARSIVPPSK